MRDFQPTLPNNMHDIASSNTKAHFLNLVLQIPRQFPDLDLEFSVPLSAPGVVIWLETPMSRDTGFSQSRD